MSRRSFPPIRNSFSIGSSGLLTARCCHSLALPPLVGNRRAPQHASLASVGRSGYGHGGLTFSSESKGRRFDPASGHHILGVHSDDPVGFVMIRPRRLSVFGTSVTARHI